MAIPPNSPYAVLSLQDHYSISHSLELFELARHPPAIFVDLACKVPMEDACEKRIQQLTSGLCGDETRQAHLDQFMETWATEDVVLRDSFCEKCFDRLVEVWVGDMEWERSCAWGSFIWLRSDQHLNNHFTHVMDHLEGRIP